MAKKASKGTKKIKKAKPAKVAQKGKQKAVKVASKPTAKKKIVKPAKPQKVVKKVPLKKKKAAPQPVKKAAQVQKEKIVKVKAPEKKIKAEKPVKVKKGEEAQPSELDLELAAADFQEVKKSKKQSLPKQKKIKKVFIPFNPIQPATATGKPVNTSKKEPKGKFELEYVIRCSEQLLYEFTTSPSGLSEWFADDVNIRDGIYTFLWDGSEQKARLLALKEDSFIRYQWIDKTDGSYFEFRIQTDDLTGDVSLIIVDFADSEEEKQSSKLLWDAQVDRLMKTIGTHG